MSGIIWEVGNMLSPSMYRSQEQLSKSMVQDLLNGGPTRAAASASQFISRRMATPATTFSPKIGLRRPVYSTVINRSAIEAPEMISLGPANNTSVASLSTNSTSVSSRPIIQRPIVLRNRTDASSSVSNQPVRLPSRCIATLNTSRPLPNWRNRSTISLDSRMRRPPMNLVLPMDYSN
ncbi:unnamed protein product, partial [Onchocerca flexuosa]|uniref:Uncharacterized protein n=1 Tax=Onchocerca flexuosa TaxID=387005 RepID=A0A183HJ56_9BILA